MYAVFHRVRPVGGVISVKAFKVTKVNCPILRQVVYTFDHLAYPGLRLEYPALNDRPEERVTVAACGQCF